MTDQHPPAPGRFAHASGSSTDEQSTDPSDASDRDTDDPTRPMTPKKLPLAATYLIDDHDDRGSPHNDANPRAALRLVRDAIVLHESNTRRTVLQRGDYEVAIGAPPDGWEEPGATSLQLRCVTNTVVPDARNPGTTAQTVTTLWVKPVRVAREIVTDYLGSDAFEQFTPSEEGR
jgi:hypothetical protein